MTPGGPAPGEALAPVSAVLEAGRDEGLAAALAAEVRARGRTVHRSVHGACSGRRLRSDDLFDVASLTKVMATGTLAAVLHGEGRFPLDAPAGRWLPGFAGAKAAVTLRHLLAHSSGLPAWRSLRRIAECRPTCSEIAVEAAIAAEPLEAGPGTRAVYSDLGFIALGMALERIAGAPLDVLCEDRVFGPLRLSRTFFLPGRSPRLVAERRAASAFVPTREAGTGEERAGEPHDENARALGGVSGHAGLFSTAGDAAALGQAWLDALAGRAGPLPVGAARAFAARDGAPGSARALAWDTPSGAEPAIGSRLGTGPMGALGHLGFTGCSLWIDLDREVVCALLTNHCQEPGSPERIRALRRRFHDAVAEGLGV